MLSATNLTRRFGDRVAVDNISLTLEPGRILALLGPNGAGKTTTLRMLAGLIAPSSGVVEIKGSVLSRHTASRLRSQVGFLTEAPGLWDRLSVRQNLSVYARLQGVAQPARAVSDMLALFGLTDRAGQKAALLSKGLKQRVALARTLIHRPSIVLLDEPTSGLDPQSARDVRDLILGMRKEGRAVLLSTHNLDEVERVADRVGILRTRLVALDSPAALRTRLFGSQLRVVLAQPSAPFASVIAGPGIEGVTVDDRQLVVSIDDAALRTPAVIRQLVHAGADVLSVVPHERSLEDVYLRVLDDEGAG